MSRFAWYVFDDYLKTQPACEIAKLVRDTHCPRVAVGEGRSYSSAPPQRLHPSKSNESAAPTHFILPQPSLPYSIVFTTLAYEHLPIP